MRCRRQARKRCDLPAILLERTQRRTLLHTVDERDALHENAEMFRTNRVQLFSCSFSLSLRDLEALMAERGLTVDHTTIWRWVQTYGPELYRRLRGQVKRKSSTWHMDETFIRIG